jgi:hypothetical protein
MWAIDHPIVDARAITLSAGVPRVGRVAPQAESADPADVAITEEYRTLKTRVKDARERADRLRSLADHLERQASRDEHAIGEIEGALGLAPQLQIEQLDEQLGGKRLREIAVHVLAQEVQLGQTVHYRDWYALLCAAGYRARGKDPLACFLAQINRADEVEPVGGRSGKYRLRDVSTHRSDSSASGRRPVE